MVDVVGEDLRSRGAGLGRLRHDERGRHQDDDGADAARRTHPLPRRQPLLAGVDLAVRHPAPFPLSSGTYLADRKHVAGPLGRPPRRPLGPPAERRRPLGVGGRNDQPPEDGQVLQEMRALHGLGLG